MRRASPARSSRSSPGAASIVLIRRMSPPKLALGVTTLPVFTRAAGPDPIRKSRRKFNSLPDSFYISNQASHA